MRPRKVKEGAGGGGGSDEEEYDYRDEPLAITGPNMADATGLDALRALSGAAALPLESAPAPDLSRIFSNSEGAHFGVSGLPEDGYDSIAASALAERRAALRAAADADGGALADIDETGCNDGGAFDDEFEAALDVDTRAAVHAQLDGLILPDGSINEHAVAALGLGGVGGGAGGDDLGEELFGDSALSFEQLLANELGLLT